MKNVGLFLVSLLAATVAITLPLSLTVQGCGVEPTPQIKTEVHVSGTQWGGMPCSFNVWSFSEENGYQFLYDVNACHYGE